MQYTVEIIPAIIPQSWEEIEAKTEQIRGLTKTVQIDITDGVFVPKKVGRIFHRGVTNLSRLCAEKKVFRTGKS